MPKTLADLNHNQRLNCIGMWADVDGEDYLALIVRTYPSDDVKHAQMLAPEIDHYYRAHISTVKPRPDLPRAFTSMGYPTDES